VIIGRLREKGKSQKAYQNGKDLFSRQKTDSQLQKPKNGRKIFAKSLPEIEPQLYAGRNLSGIMQSKSEYKRGL
jgi:hypothetical protein